MQAVLDESAALLRAERGILICETHTGLVCANAGVDRSNAAEGELILLPEDPDASARSLRAGLAEALGVRPAVVIADSFGRPWRLGQTDVAIGAAGLTPLDDWRGRRDAAGRELSATAIAVADAVAAAADLARDKDSEEPAVLVRGLGRFVTDDGRAGGGRPAPPAGREPVRLGARGARAGLDGEREAARPLGRRGAIGLGGCHTGAEQLAEGVHDLRVELLAGAAAQLLHRGLGIDRAAVGPVRGHRVEGVADGHDACPERDVVARQGVRVARAVEVLVARADHLGHLR